MADTSLPKGYEPKDVEARWGKHWEEDTTFTPDPEGPGEPFSIVIPPPNVTGALHMGHALNQTVQDIVCRHMRQLGRKVLWVPGTDHAGIATQNVVERKLKAEGKTRHDLGREKFLEEVWKWKEEYGGRITNQLRRLGSSVDWTRERFTMDEGLSRAVREVFVSLYEQGLIYRGEYIINWCPRCHTALADDEVEYSPHTGTLYHIRYPLADGSGEVVIATVRPETMLGDTAVAVHPDDERYQALIGKEVILPLVGRRLPVIADSYVEREFGTGCLKVTPAHDMNDWDLGKKHDLPVIKVIDDMGNMTAEAGEKYQGLSVLACRERIVEDLTAGGFLLKAEEYEHKISQCYRCATTIEPHVSKQWFVSVKPLAAKAREAVESGRTKIHPVTWEKTYFNWLDNIRDWCISRQLWWGHRIPVWYCDACGRTICSREDPTHCECGAELRRDEDVLDTWFSSALWPFSTMGWPDKTPELAAFYPTSLLVTAFDILFFWVARMMMMGLHFMDDVPFRDVYIHALVRDEEGKKMSKSTGNVIDPIEMIDKYGCDALRFTLAAFAAMGRDIRLSEARIEGYRHFVNKLWNAARFALMNLDGEPAEASPEAAKGLHHRWILSRLEGLKVDVAKSLAEYRFNDAAQGLYAFVWQEFCDWYLEMLKLDMQDDAAREPARRVLLTVLSETLVLLHPIMPFVTQEIWTYLPGKEQSDIATAPYPAARPACASPEAEASMKLLQEVIVGLRNIRGELNIAPSLELAAVLRTTNGTAKAVLEEGAAQIKRLARIGELLIGPDATAPKASAAAVAPGVEIRVPLEGAVNFGDELARLDKELGKIEKDYAVVQKKLNNEGFLANAPADVVAKERDKLAVMDEKRDKLQKLKDRLKSVMS
ncbi:Valyl-tRNA synthetase [Desulfovibrio sp. X2]|uniref:valine--tRNA ligase n=1 Tax=Desulfovibrio sp. X2 TaxID=941449 RepID=UPI0003586F27|nr:valine--tRNA ligase [Desulfovibrio sp. X2]EPR43940.1 Valyl-tRNA synthetase [Desulfovibrio sp. X2]